MRCRTWKEPAAAGNGWERVKGILERPAETCPEELHVLARRNQKPTLGHGVIDVFPSYA